MTSSLRHASLLSLAVASLVGCASTSAETNELNASAVSEGTEAYTAPLAAVWMSLVHDGRTNYLRGVNGVNLKCADGTSSYQCPVGAVDLSKLGVTPANMATVQQLLDDEMLIVFGKPVANAATRVVNVKPTRAFENITGWFDNGNRHKIYEVKLLASPKPCDVVRMTSTPNPGVVFPPPPAVRTVARKSCLYAATELNTGIQKTLDDVDYTDSASSVPGALPDIAARLARRSPVAFDAGGVSNYTMPYETSDTVHTWLDVKKSYGR